MDISTPPRSTQAQQVQRKLTPPRVVQDAGRSSSSPEQAPRAIPAPPDAGASDSAVGGERASGWLPGVSVATGRLAQQVQRKLTPPRVVQDAGRSSSSPEQAPRAVLAPAGLGASFSLIGGERILARAGGERVSRASLATRRLAQQVQRKLTPPRVVQDTGRSSSSPEQAPRAVPAPPAILAPPVRVDSFSFFGGERASRASLGGAAFFEEREVYLVQLDALKLLQSAFRRRKWRIALSKRIPLVNGPCGQRAFPIFHKATLVGMEGRSGRQYRHSSFGMDVAHPLRVWAIFVIEHPWFERASLLAIVANCIMLAVQGPPGRYESLDKDAQLTLELVFTLLFTLELGCKCVAMGFAGHEHSCAAAKELSLLLPVACLLLPIARIEPTASTGCPWPSCQERPLPPSPLLSIEQVSERRLALARLPGGDYELAATSVSLDGQLHSDAGGASAASAAHDQSASWHAAPGEHPLRLVAPPARRGSSFHLHHGRLRSAWAAALQGDPSPSLVR